jgi:hypothetical protein
LPEQIRAIFNAKVVQCSTVLVEAMNLKLLPVQGIQQLSGQDRRHVSTLLTVVDDSLQVEPYFQ